MSATIESLALTGGTLSVQSGSMTVGTMTQGAGTLSGAGTLKVAELLKWEGEGTWKGSGSTVILPGATAATEATGSERIEKRHLINEGTFTAAVGTLLLSEGAEIVNTGTFKANYEASAVISMYGTGGTFVNAGTFKKTSGTEVTGSEVNFTNEGAVEAQTGTLAFSGGGSSNSGGSWKSAEGAELEFQNGTYNFKGGTMSGAVNLPAEYLPGTLNVEGVSATLERLAIPAGTLNIQSGSMTVGTMNMGSGILEGAGALKVSESLSWTGAGPWKGSGSTVILPGATATTEATGSEPIEERQLINEGTFTAAVGTLLLSEGAEIVNTGTFNANEEEFGVIGEYGTGGTFVNSGTFQKTSGTEASWSEINFENEGTVDAQSGALAFRGGGSSNSSGSWKSSKGAELQFAGGTYSLNGSSLSGAVQLPVSFGCSPTVNLEGVSATLTSLVLNCGTLNVQSGSATVGSMTVGSGTLGGAGTLQVSNSLIWKAESTMAGSGSTVILPGATATTAEMGGSYVRIEGRRLVNEGTFTAAVGELLLNEGAEIVNTGTFNANEEAIETIGGYGEEGVFVNNGTFQKTSGTETSVIGLPFENQGTIDEGPGHIKIEHPIVRLASDHFEKECQGGDPVNCATGNYTEPQTDFAIGGRGVGLDLTRTYSAQAAATAASPGAFGYGWNNSFGDHLIVEGETATVVEGNGNTVPFTKSDESSFKAPAWSQDTLSGSAEAGYTLTLPEQTKYAFSGAGKLESVTDRNGNKTTLAYTEAGKLKTITDPVSRKITLTYNEAGLVESAKDPMGHTVKYTYEGQNLASVTEPGEAEPRWQFEYDGSHRITKVTNGLGGETTNEYDGSNRVISQTNPVENTLTFEYAPFHTTITNTATGSVTDERFTSNNEPYSVTRGIGTASATTEAFSYNVAGQLRNRTDGNGHETTYSYDSNGNRKSDKDAAGDETKWTYNETHDVISMTTPREETTTIKRDGNGNPETISRPAPGATTQTSSYEFGSHGELKSVTDPLERTWSYEYDSYGDPKAEIDPEGDKRTWTYNEDSQLTSTVSPRGNEEGAEPSKFATTIERDAQGRPEEVTDPLKGTTKYTYDPDGNQKTEADPNSHKTTFTYDADNEQTKVEEPNGDVLETGYDGAGQVASQTDGNKHTTTYVRNVLEEPIEVIDPLKRKTTQEYDGAGNLKATSDPSKRKTSYAYDAANRLKEISYSEGGMSTVKFGHDKDGNLTSMSDGTGESSYEYDQLGRLIHSKDGHGNTVGYEYNLGNERTGITYPNGESITRAFDNAGRLKSITDWLGHTTAFAYNRDSEPKSATFPTATGNLDEYAYDHADRISEVKMKKGAEALASLGYTRDKVGQIESLISKGLPGAETESLSYDENERLTKAGVGSYEYDAANNLTKAPGTTNKYDVASQLETGTGTTYAYDEEGERTKLTPSGGPATTYKYNQAGNLSAVERSKEGETAAISESYTYDGTGLRASRTVSGTTSYLTWDKSAGLPLILNDGQNSYIYGPSGLPTEQISSGETPIYLHHDQLGSTRALTNASGEATATFSYGPYGAPVSHTGSGTTPLGFAGQYTDAESGLQYLRGRYYDPATGQFVTRDPLSPVSRYPYGYVADDPINGTDPTGLLTIGVCVSGSAFPGGIFGFVGSVCAQGSTSGDIGVTATGGPVAGAGSPNISAGPGLEVSNADHISQLTSIHRFHPAG